MTLDGVLTLAALLVAVYAILPRSRTLELRLLLSTFEWLVIGVAAAGIFYFEFFSFFASIGFIPHLGLMQRYGLSPQSISFLIVFFASTVLFFEVRTKKLSPNRSEAFRDLLEELISEKKHPEVIFLFERHLDRLIKLLRADFAMQRIKRAIAHLDENKVDLDRLALVLTDPTELNHSDYKYWGLANMRRIVASMSKIIPGNERSQEAAASTIRTVLLSSELTRYIAINRPYLAFRILEYQLFEEEEFLDSYIRELLVNRGGTLYFEIKNNENLERRHLYRIPKENRILGYFLADPKVAERLGVYKPVGDFFLEELERLGKAPDLDPYNDDSQDFLEREAWASSLFISIRFFDIMLSRALYSNVAWHMWLYYLPPAIELMAENYHPRIGIDLSREWPTKYHYLIYASVNVLVDLVGALPDIPSNQENIQLESTAAIHENGNIPKSSILALGDCLCTILSSEKLTDQFKKYLLGIVLRLYLQLRGTHPHYAKALLLSVKSGGPEIGCPDDAYRQKLHQFWTTADKIHFNSADISELERLLFSEQGES